MAAETEKTGWTIDGRVYEDPEKFTTAEHRIIKRYTGLDFVALDKKTGSDLMADQDFLAALMHISYRREHRDMSFDQIEEVVGDQDLETAMTTLSSGEGDVDPPALTNKSDESSEKSSTGSSKSSGSSSSESSDLSAKTHSVTTTAESDTSSLVSAAGMSAT